VKIGNDEDEGEFKTRIDGEGNGVGKEVEFE